MSYIENLLGNPVLPEVQESLGLAAGNYKIKGFNIFILGSYAILSEGLALIDGLRVVSSANLQLPTSAVYSKYIFLRIRTYTEVVDGNVNVQEELSLIAQTSNIPVNNDNLYEGIGTKDVLLAYVNSSGVVDLTTNGALIYYDVPTRLTSIEGVNATQDTSISSLETRATNIETKNTEQDTRLTNVESKNTTQDTRLTNIETKNTEQDTRLTTLEAATPEADTGWIDISEILNTANFTSPGLFARRIGKVVEIKGEIVAAKDHTTTTTSVPWTKNPSGLAAQFLPSKAEKAVNIGRNFMLLWVELTPGGTGTIVRTTVNLAATNASNINLKYTTD